MINACCGNEANSEYIVFQTGSSSLTINSTTLSVEVPHPGNPTNGNPVGGWSGNAGIVTALNNLLNVPVGSCTSGPVFIDAMNAPTNGVIPADAIVWAFMSNPPTISCYTTLNGLCGSDDIYIVFGDYNPTGTQPAIFQNGPSCGSPCFRPIEITIGPCDYSIQYDASLFVTGGRADQDGDNISPGPNGTVSHNFSDGTPCAPEGVFCSDPMAPVLGHDTLFRCSSDPLPVPVTSCGGCTASTEWVNNSGDSVYAGPSDFPPDISFYPPAGSASTYYAINYEGVCASAPDSVVLVTYPSPPPNGNLVCIPPTCVICSGDSVQLRYFSSPFIEPYYIYYSDGTTSDSVLVTGQPFDFSVGPIFSPVTITVFQHQLRNCLIVPGGNTSRLIDVVAPPPAAIQPVDTICNQVDYLMQLTGGSTTGGTWSINNGGAIDPSTGNITGTSLVAGSTYIVQYQVGSPCDTVASDTFLAVGPGQAMLVDLDTACISRIGAQFDFLPGAGGSDPNGTWTINNGATITSTGTATFPGGYNGQTYIVSYTVGTGDCQAVASDTLVAIRQAGAGLAFIPAQCASGTVSADFTPGSDPGGVFSISSPGVINPATGDIDLAAGGPGTFTVTYIVGDSPCQDTATRSFNVLPATDPMAANIGPFCESDPSEVLVTNNNGITGNWSGPGVSSNVFDPTAAGSAGSPHTLIFTPDMGQCASNDTIIVVVNAAILPMLDTVLPLCETDAAVTLNTMQSGVDGTWSGPGVSGNQFDPGAAGSAGSPHTITFTPTPGPGVCAFTNTTQVIVNAATTPILTPIDTFCETDPNFSLSTMQDGVTGNWSGTGIVGNQFNPGSAGAAGSPHTLTFMPDPGQCANNNTIDVVVEMVITPTLTTIPPICETDPAITLNNTQDGIMGTWSGPGVTGNMFDPSAAGSGGSPHTLTFTPAAGECAMANTIDVVVDAPQTPTLTGIGPYCETDTPENLMTTQDGFTGTWSGPGVTSNIFDPGNAGPAGSPHTLTFTPDAGQCAASATIMVTVDMASTPMLTAIGPYCESEGAVTLATTQDGIMGTWSGPGVTGNMFDPTAAGSGGSPHTLTFTPNPGQCAFDNTIDVIVNPEIAPVLTSIGPFCELDGAVNLNTTQSTITGNWSGPGVTGNQFDPGAAGSAGSPHTLTFTPNVGQCATVNTIDVVVDMAVTPTLTPIDTFCVTDALFNLPTTEDGIIGNWSGPGVSLNQFDPASAGSAGSPHALTFTPDTPQCALANTIDVVVEDEMAPMLTGIGPFCELDMAVNLITTQDGIEGDWSGPGVSSNLFDPSGSGANGIPVVLTFTPDAGQCASIDTIQVTVDTAIVPVLSPIAPLCDDDPAVMLGTTQSGITGMWSGTGVTGNSFDPMSAGAGTWTLTFTPDIGQCAVSNSIMVTVNQCNCGMPPTADAGADITICETEVANLIGMIGGTASSSVWSSNGDGTFGDTTMTTTDYTPGTGDITNGTVILTLTTDDPDGVGPCIPSSDQLILTILSQIVPTLDPLGPFCETDGAVALSTMQAGIDGNWSGPGVMANNFDPSMAGSTGSPHILTFTPDAGECALPDTIHVVVDSAITPILTPIDTLCETDPVYNLPLIQDGIDGMWSGTGVSSNQFDPGVSGASGSPYTLTFNPNVGECAQTNTLILIVEAETAPTLPAIGPFCITDAATTLISNPSGITGVWSGQGVIGNMFDPATAGSTGSPHTLTFTPDIGQCALNSTIDVIVDSLYVPMLTPIGPVCADDSPEPLNATQDGISGSWSGPGISGGAFDPAAVGVGSYFLVFTPGPTECAATDSINVIVNNCTCTNPPTVDAGVDITICETDVATISATIGGAASTFTWSTSGDGTFTNTTSSPTDYTPGATDISNGTVTITVTTDDPDGAGPCVAATDDAVISIDPQITPVLMNIGPFCETDMSIALNTLQDGVNGSWSGSGVTANTFDPGAAGSAGSPHTLTFMPDAGECALTNTILVVVDAANAPILTSIDPLCQTAAAVFLDTIQDGVNGVWSGSGVIGHVFDPSIVTAAGSPYTLTFTPDTSFCANQNSIIVAIDSSIIPMLTPIADLCETDPAVSLSGSQGGVLGSWSGPGVVGGTFNPMTAGSAGSPHTLIFTPDADQCAEIDSIMVIVNEAIMPSLPALGPYCTDDAAVNLDTIQDGIDGVWSGTGVVNGQFDPAIAGAGSWNLTFTPDAGQCAIPAMISVEVNQCNCTDPPTVNAGGDITICEDEIADVTGIIGGTATTNTWSTSGDGAFGDPTMLVTTYTPGATDIANGTVTLTLTTDDPDGAGPCVAASDQLTLSIDMEVTPTLMMIGPFCQLDPIVSLNTNQSGIDGTWSGNGVTTNMFDPSVAGAANSPHTLTFTPEANECAEPATISVVVDSAILPNLIPMTALCELDNPITLMQTQNGVSGTWSGPGVSANMFDPSVAGAAGSPYTLTFTPNTGECAQQNTLQVTVNAAITPTLTNLGPYCETDPVVALNPMQDGINGSWSGAGVVGNMFDPSAAGAAGSPHTLTFTPDAGQCAVSATISVVVDAAAVPTLTQIGPYCATDPVVSLMMNQSGITGTWSGPGVTANQFDPATAGAAGSPHTLTFTPDAGECALSGSIQVVVNDPVVPTLDQIGPFCETDNAATLLTMQDGINGSWSGPGVNANEFDPAIAGTAGSPHTLTFTPTTGQCASVATLTVIVDTLFVPELTPIGPFCDDDMSVDLLTRQDGIDGQWSGTGVTANSFDPVSAGPGTWTLTFTPDVGQCADINTINVLVEQCDCMNPPMVDAGADIDICEIDTAFLMATLAGSASTGIWSTAGDGTFENTNNLSTFYIPGINDIESGLVILTITTDDPDGAGPCVASSDQISVFITQLRSPLLDVIGPFCETDMAVQLNVIQDGILGSWSGPGVNANEFDPGSAGSAGSPHTLTFIPNSGECATANSISVIVDEAIEPTLDPLGPYCETGPLVQLAIFQDGVNGSWSGPGVIANEFDPGLAGTAGSPHLLTFTPIVGECAIAATINVVVSEETTPQLGPYGPYCEDDPTVNLPPVIDGINGDWSGPGVSFNVFDPLAAGASGSAHVLVFTPTTGQCAVTASIDVFVNPLDVILLPNLGPYCETDPIITLDPMQSGVNGTWSGPGISSNTFNPSIAGSISSPHTLTFTPDATECAAITTIMVSVTAELLPMLDPISVLCDTNMAVSLNPLQNGILGSWSGTGVSGNEFDPAVAGGGIWTLIFTPNPNQCAQVNTINVMVEQCNCPMPPTAFAGDDLAICATDSAFIVGVIGGSASAAVWMTDGDGSFGDATSLSTFYIPGSNDIDDGFVILQLVTDDPDGAGSCSPATDEIIVFIDEPQLPILPSFGPYCDIDSIVGLSTIHSGVQGSWTGAGVMNNQFNPLQAGHGMWTLTFTPEAGECALPNSTIVAVDSGLCSDNCFIVSGELGVVRCDQNGTPLDPTDDIIVFTLDPQGSGLSNVYSLTSTSGVVQPDSGFYGMPTTFRLTPGTAGGGPVVVTIVDPSDLNCSFGVFINDPGPCSSGCMTDTTVVFDTTCDPMLSNDTTSMTVLGSDGCDSVLINVFFLIPPTRDTVVGFTCDMMQFGFVPDTMPSVLGCDSIVVTNFIFDVSAIDSTIILVNTCDPTETEDQRDTIVGSSGCDSIIIMRPVLAPSYNDTLVQFTCDMTQVGFIPDTLPSELGCDSIIVTNFIFDVNAIDSTIILINTCDPTQTEDQRDTIVGSSGCDSIIIMRPVLAPSYNDTLVQFTCDMTQVGFVPDTLPTELGCDSIIVTNFIFDVNAIDSTIILINTCDPTQTEDQRDTIVGSSGCDSIIIMRPVLAPSYNDTLVQFTCDMTQVGFVPDTLLTELGCDSIIVINFIFDVNAIDSTIILINTCDPTQTEDQRDTIVGSSGCDSIIIMRPVLAPSYNDTLVRLTCDMMQVGFVPDTMPTEFGCDSIIVTNFVFDANAVDTNVFVEMTCNPADTGTVQFLLMNNIGCDSLVIIHTVLMGIPTPLTFIELITCNISEVDTDTVTFISSTGCDSIVVINTSLGTFDLEVDPVLSNISPGDSIQLILSSTIDLNTTDIIWSPSTNLSCDTCITTIASPDETTTYLATVTDVFGCVATATAVIRVDNGSIYIPNVFSPNNDGINDVFTLYSDRDIFIESIEIFNRWGGKVFMRADIPLADFDGWDGVIIDKLAKEDVYVYQVRARIGSAPTQILKGEIHLVR